MVSRITCGSRVVPVRRRIGALLFLLAACCAPSPIHVEQRAATLNQPIDFARALTLGNMAFDVTANRTITDETLRQRYASADVDVILFSTTLPGDDGITRFMLLTDNANRRHTLVLAGTNTSIQWAFDALTPLVFQSDLNAAVHVGWHTLAFGVYNNILPELRSDYSITVTGFSLGAALSCIVSEYLIIAGYTVDEVVTFGQPRVTDSAGVFSFSNLPLTRFVNDGDPFPHMKGHGSPGAHFGPMVVLHDDATFAYVPANDPRQEMGTRPFAEFEIEEFGFHAEALYRQRIEAKLTAPTQVTYAP